MFSARVLWRPPEERFPQLNVPLGHTSSVDQLGGLRCGSSVLFKLGPNMGIACLFYDPDLGFGLYSIGTRESNRMYWVVEGEL